MVKIGICVFCTGLVFGVTEIWAGRTPSEVLKMPVNLYKKARRSFNSIGAHIAVALFLPFCPALIVCGGLGVIIYDIGYLFVLLFGIK